jgi:anhydro-N-acetylmuramic acid kinase
MVDLYIGLMSGTSLDGVDGVLVAFSGTAPGLSMQVRAHAHRAFAPELARELLALNGPGANEIHRAALAANALGRRYADVVVAVLQHAQIAAADVTAIGAHGQTLRHCPGEFDGVGYTVQLNQPALLAELTGIDVVADFRSRDVAAGGQGAPLVPAFHRAAFGRPDETIVVLNLGGISNVSVLARDGATSGFDCGPANVLLDHWCALHRAAPYDHDGDWAASGEVNVGLLALMQDEAYFARSPPKSTGRDLFNARWLDRCVQQATATAGISPNDVQATLAELTAWCCQQAVTRHAPDAVRLVVCGGGARNSHVMRRLAALLPRLSVESTDRYGMPIDQVEAVAFAWLAQAWISKRAGNLPEVTGARGPRVLGAMYPSE